MTTVTVTPANLTFEHIKSWDGAEMKRQMAHPEMRTAISEVIKNKSLEEVLALEVAKNAEQLPVEAPAEEIPVAPVESTAEEIETQRLATEQATAREAAVKLENEELATAGITVYRDQSGNIIKLVQDYQVVDEHGVAIGRPTHLEARNWPELCIKQRDAHTHATRAFHRLKTQKITFKEQQTQSVPAQQSDSELLAAMKDLKSDDPQKQLEAVRKVNKAEIDRIKAESDQKLAELEELRRQEKVSIQFLANHKHDFNNCQANIELIKNYFMENELAWTSDNLEIAFHALESELAPVAAPVPPAVPANPAPAQAPVIQTTPVATVAVQPQPTAPAQTVAPANPAVTAPRPGVNGGIVPGQSSATRPAAQAPKGLTAEEIKSWDGPTMRAKMRDTRIRPQIEAFFASRAQGKK